MFSMRVGYAMDVVVVVVVVIIMVCHIQVMSQEIKSNLAAALDAWA